MQLVPIEDRVLSLGAPLGSQSLFYVASLNQNIITWFSFFFFFTGPADNPAGLQHWLNWVAYPEVVTL